MAALAIQAAGDDGQGHLSVDIRAQRAVLRLQSATEWAVTGLDIGLAQAISAALRSEERRVGKECRL